jgi:hypothetical protein
VQLRELPEQKWGEEIELVLFYNLLVPIMSAFDLELAERLFLGDAIRHFATPKPLH